MNSTGMWTKYKNGDITCQEYTKYLAKNAGFNDIKEYLNHKAQLRGFKDINHYNKYHAHLNRQDTKEYREKTARAQGYNSYNDYRKQYGYKNGKHKPMSENKACAAYLGVYIAERVLSKIFDNVVTMPYGHKEYDFICNKGYKIQVKSSCMWVCHKNDTKRKEKNMWSFGIKKNRIADYFLLIAFDNRNNITPMHIWLIKGSETIITNEHPKQLNERVTFNISNTFEVIQKYISYERTDKLEKAILLCDTVKKTE